MPFLRTERRYLPSVLLRIVLLPLLTLVAACGGGGAAVGPTEEQTYYCGSYEPLGEANVSTEPPC